MIKTILGRKGLVLSYTSRSWSITEGSQGKNWMEQGRNLEAGSKKQKLLGKAAY